METFCWETCGWLYINYLSRFPASLYFSILFYTFFFFFCRLSCPGAVFHQLPLWKWHCGCIIATLTALPIGQEIRVLVATVTQQENDVSLLCEKLIQDRQQGQSELSHFIIIKKKIHRTWISKKIKRTKYIPSSGQYGTHILVPRYRVIVYFMGPYLWYPASLFNTYLMLKWWDAFHLWTALL